MSRQFETIEKISQFAGETFHVKDHCKLKYWIFTLELWQTFAFLFEILWYVNFWRCFTRYSVFFNLISKLIKCLQTWLGFTVQVILTKVILFQSSLQLLTLKQKMYFLTEKTCVAVHASADILLQLLNSLTIQKKWKDISSNAACAFYTKHKDKFASPKQKQPTFLVKINTAWGKGLLGSRRQTLDACNFPAVVVHQCF